MKKPPNPHTREHLFVFGLIYGAMWFASLKEIKGQPIATDILALMLITVVSSAVLYLVFGRIMVWIWIFCADIGAAWSSKAHEAARHRSTMQEIAAKLALEPTPIQQVNNPPPRRTLERLNIETSPINRTVN